MWEHKLLHKAGVNYLLQTEELIKNLHVNWHIRPFLCPASAKQVGRLIPSKQKRGKRNSEFLTGHESNSAKLNLMLEDEHCKIISREK